MTRAEQQEQAARQLATENFGNDEHWRSYLGTFACASRALGNAIEEFKITVLAQLGIKRNG